jgi:hypothetical protein
MAYGSSGNARRGLVRVALFRSPMHKNVETLIGRLATDPALRRRFTEDPVTVLLELAEGGLELTSVELQALAAIDPETLRAFASSLDRRLRKAAVATPTPTALDKENDR